MVLKDIKETSYGPLMTGIMVNEACDLESHLWVADVDTKCHVADVSSRIGFYIIYFLEY